MMLVRENIRFERGRDPKKVMGIGQIELINKFILEYAHKEWVDDFKANIHNFKYTINKDGTIDVVGDISFNQCGLDELPNYIQFNHIEGDFLVNWNNLTDLKGCPRIVTGDFLANGNPLTSLEGIPEEVGGRVVISDACGFSIEDIKSACKCRNVQLTYSVAEDTVQKLKTKRDRYIK